jgi:3'-phosphoadenosine 5'-phosphosulfate sulfotransferase (PAPS reductase)/FAD synthetase
MKLTCMNYGGGRQTVAMCVLIAKGVIDRPDVIVMADTGRENPMTWEYLNEYVQPLLQTIGMQVEVASRELATVDLYSHKGTVLIPAFTATGKFSAYCSGEWKRDVVQRHLRGKGATGGLTWLGFSYDEKRRWQRSIGTTRNGWTVQCPLVEHTIGDGDCLTIIERQGWPLPHRSSCWMCPHKSNSEWRHIRDNYPAEWQQAVAIDQEIRENDERCELWLHKDRVPLAEADLSKHETAQQYRQCSLGMCFV